MINLQINLLPKLRKQRFHLTQKQWKIAAGSAAGLLVLVFVIWGVVVWAQKSSLASEQTDWNQKLTAINSQIEGGKEIAQKAEGLSEQLDTIKTLLEKHPRWSLVLKQLSSLTPANIQLINLAGETTGKINLSGVTADYKAAAVFVKSLQTSDYFTNIELGSAGLTEQAGQFKIGFNLTLELTAKALQGQEETSNTAQTTQ
jgi:Tfp pilus assembly protein PilN